MNTILATLIGLATCQNLTWTSPPVVSGSTFKGTISVTCNYTGKDGRGFQQLENFMLETLRSEAKQIFAGPIYGQSEGMPSTAYDFSMLLNFQGEQVTVREDSYIATDLREKLIVALNSKSIQATGNGKYLSKLNVRFDVGANPTPGSYRATLSAQVEAKKPGIVPAETFRTQLRDGIQKIVGDYRDKVMKALEDNT